MIITKFVADKCRRTGERLKNIFLWILLAGFLFCAPDGAFPHNSGFKYMKNFSAKENSWHRQNWSILQDKRGCLYVANQGALLEFDGVAWRRIIIPNMTVRSMAMDDATGTLFIGGRDQIGFLAPAPGGKGSLQYQSLLEHLDKSKRNFANVLGTHATGEGIYFRTYYYLFKWHDGKLRVTAETDENHRFRGSFCCGGKVYVRIDNVGLAQLTDDKLVPVPGGGIFASKKIFMMVPHTGQDLLIGTRAYGMYIYNYRDKAVSFKTGADDYLRENQLYYGTRLTSGDYALATRMGGVVIMDPRGGIKRVYRKSGGLLDNYVRYVFEDVQGNLWIAQDKGISKIEHASPVSIYDDRCGLPGIITTVVVHGPAKDLYAGSTSGLFYMSESGRFLQAPGMTQQCFDLLSTGDSLLAATGSGVFNVGEKNHRAIITTRAYALCRSRTDNRRIWAGTSQGLVSLYRSVDMDNESRWRQEHLFQNIRQSIFSIAEQPDGTLWLGTATGSGIKIDFPGQGSLTGAVATAREIPGELNPKMVFVAPAAGHMMFATAKGLYRFKEETNELVPDLTFGESFTDGSAGVFRLAVDKNGHAWLHSEKRNLRAIPQPDGTFSVETQPFLRIPNAQVNAIYPDPSGDAVWFAASDGLIRFDTTVEKDYRKDFQTLIRKLSVNGEPVFNGSRSGIDKNVSANAAVFEYKDRNLDFQFAAPFFEGETKTRYRTILEGYDDHWSEPAAETSKHYTNLDSGSYTFRVKAENVYGVTGREDSFRFRVMPPWYRTWWAYSIYAVVFFMIMFFIVRWRSGKLEREKRRLEQIVKERTGEIEEKNKQLEIQTFQLKDQSEKLTEMDKVKTRFFANISHEFRTPLTLIMGPLEEMLTENENRGDDAAEKRKLGLMLRNSRRLLNLINQLLELSKIESGKMKLDASLQNVVPFLKGIVASFESVAIKNELDLRFVYEEEEIILFMDTGKMEEVFFNLLSNAVKFTPPGGRITVTVRRHAPEAEYPSGSVTLSVRDTGPGIPREQLGHIFDRFYQSDSTYEHHKKGSGIGLTIAKELVELHHARIDVHSIEGKGTEFIITGQTGSVKAAQTGSGEAGQTGSVKAAQTIDDRIRMLGIPDRDEEPGITGPENSGDGDKNIILVVEDSADARAYIRSSLEPTYRVVEAENGDEGIQKALEYIPDLIVSDIMMPEKDGYELCRELKNHVNTSHIPIILLTAKAGEADVLEGLETGADDYVTKPFNTRILCARIKNLIDLRSHLQQVMDRDMTLQPAKIPVSRIDKEFIVKLKEVIKPNISDPDFNIEQLCVKMGMSQPTLYRKIRALSGESPTDFIRSYRLKRGARLLEEKFGSVIEVALEVGFSSAAYFTKCFKKKFDRLPSEYLETTVN